MIVAALCVQDSGSMNEIVGGLGEGTVLVFQPATPTGLGLEVALGIQRLWQKTLKQAGRPAVCVIANTRVEKIEGTVPDGIPFAVGDKGVLSIGGWPDSAGNAALVQRFKSRWGLVATFTEVGTNAKLETALIEAQREDVAREISSWSFDGGAVDLSDHVCAVLVDAARRIGTKLPWKHASEAFDAGDPVARVLCLETMGVLSMAEDGCRLVIERVLDRLAALVSAAPRSRVVVTLVPELLGHLARLGAHDLQLAGWMRRVRKVVGVLPSEWEGLLSTISRDRSH